MKHAIPVGLLIVLAACDGSSPTGPSPTPGPNHPPVVTTAQISPSFGVVGLTHFSLHAAATDPDGDHLTYQWEDATHDGADAVVSFSDFTGGFVQVHVTVTDSRGASTTGKVSLTLGSLNGGSWSLSKAGALSGAILVVQQDDQGHVEGQYVWPTSPVISTFAGGTIDDTGRIHWRLTHGSAFVTFDGQMDATGRKIAGTLSPGGSFVLTKN